MEFNRKSIKNDSLRLKKDEFIEENAIKFKLKKPNASRPFVSSKRGVVNVCVYEGVCACVSNY